MDALNFGLTADRRAVPDVAVLGDYLVEATDELKRAVVRRLKPFLCPPDM